jgi:hypothetical protein
MRVLMASDRGHTGTALGLAALSNDPPGDLNPVVTYSVNLNETPHLRTATSHDAL